MSSGNHIETQVARLLEQIQILDNQYGPTIAQRDPDLARALGDAATMINRFLTRPPRVVAVPSERAGECTPLGAPIAQGPASSAECSDAQCQVPSARSIRLGPRRAPTSFDLRPGRSLSCPHD